MRVPSQDVELSAGLSLHSHEVDDQMVHEHVMKHAFGLGAIYGLIPGQSRAPEVRTRSWNAQGWDKTVPPVITEAERRERAHAVRLLTVAGTRCAASRLDLEQYAGDRPHAQMPCRVCPAPLARRCTEVLSPVGARYLREIDKASAATRDSAPLSREASGVALDRAWKTRRWPLFVASAGLLGNGSPGIRIGTSNGLRCEFYWGPQTTRWRTLYRHPIAGPNDQRSFLGALLPEDPRIPWSGICYVERLWIEDLHL